jgi:hypothetical protein
MALLKDLASSAQAFINRQLGSSKTLTTPTSSITTPWGDDPGTDIFFPTSVIEGNRWNRVYPYRLLVVDASDGNAIVGGGSDTKVQNTFFQDGSNFLLQQNITGSGWIYELPITPQQLSIADQYAINTTATARGIVEEHNGLRFKTITMAGTTGVWTRRDQKAADPKSPTSLGTLFGGTLESTGRVLDSFRRVKSVFTGENPNSPTSPDTPSLGDTGYEQILLLQNFIERYTIEKKQEKNRGWRLVLDIPKQNQSFVVTPIAFQVSQTKDRPHERSFNIQLRAWKRIDLKIGDVTAPQKTTKLDVNFFQRALNTISETRRLLANSLTLIQAVRGDFQKPLEALRQTALAIKDVGNFTYNVIDMPSQIIRDYKSSIRDSINIIKDSFSRVNSPVPVGTPATGTSANAFKFASQQEKAGFAVDQIIRASEANEGMSLDLVSEGNLGNEAIDASSLSNFNSVFDNPAAYYDFFNAIPLDLLTLTAEQQEAIQDEIDTASLINIDNLREFKKEIQELALDISNNYGTGDELYSKVYGRPAPKKRAVPLSIEENEILAALWETLQAYDALVASAQWDDFAKQSPLAFVGGIARANEVPFDDGATSKFLVPVPFGSNIEQIAARYLGDANRWIEIATLNALRSPYIDEDGFTYNLLSNGDGRQFTVNDIDRVLYLGQKITLQADNVPAFSRKITTIERLSDEVFLVTVDGVSNLNSLTTTQNARMRGYLPGTVNSQDLIYIPSNLPSIDDDRVTIPKQYQEDDLTKISKVDWLLTDNGDIALDSFGEVKLANGLTNLIQALKLKMITRRGTILAHPEYGLGLKAGISSADIVGGEVIKDMDIMIRQDPRFDGLERMSVNIREGAIVIDLAVKIKNNTGILPITFEL